MGIKSAFRNFKKLPVTAAIFACGLLTVTSTGLASSLVVPNYAATNQSVDAAEAIFTSILREQAVYNASEFPPYPIVITEIHWRPDVDSGGPITTTVSNIQINLSTTTDSADHLSLTFAQNTGTDDMVVFSGMMNIVSSFATLSNGTKAFDIDLPLQTPFLFDPSKGNLLLDLRNFTGCNASLYNNGATSVSDAASRIYNTSDPNAVVASGSDSGAGVMEIEYSPAFAVPTITSQPTPTNQVVTVGDSTTLVVAAVGQPPLSYQWFFNDTNTPVAGATNNSLTLANLQTDQSGNYFVQVSNASGSIFSSNAVLTVILTPIITSQPVNQTVQPGASATFTVAADSAMPLSYQWFFNVTNVIVGATNVSLTVTNAQIPQLGNYSVQVANTYGSKNSSNAFLSIGLVLPNYAINNQTANAAEDILNSILREQTVYNASEFPPYPIVIRDVRWRPDSITGGPVTATISNIQINLSTTTNSADHLSSTFAQNTGTNDMVAFSGMMNIVSSFTTLSNGTKAFDIDLPLQTPFLFDPSKGNLLLDLRNFTSATANVYDNAVTSVSDSTSRIYNIGNPNAATSSGSDSGAGIIEIGYTPAPLPPALDSQPAPTNQVVTVGDSATFTVTAVGPPPLSYQWFFNDRDTPVVGATNNSLTLIDLQTDQSGFYFVRVSSASGSVFSSNAVLTVVLTPIITSQPANQTMPLGASATFAVAADSAAPLSYQWFFDLTNTLVGATNASLTVTNVQIQRLGNYSVQVANAYGSTYSSTANLSIGLVVPSYAASNQLANAAEGIFNSIIREQTIYNASEFPPYPIVINDIRWRPDSITGGPVTSTISNIQVNLSTTASSADHLSSMFAQNTGTNDAVVFSGMMNIFSSFTTLSNGTKVFDIDLPFQTPFFFDPSKGNLLFDLRNFTGGTANVYDNAVTSISDTASRIYNLGDPNATNSSGGDSGGGVIEIGYIPAPLPPTIAAQPTNRTVTAGGTTTFIVLAGPPPLSYQWFYNDISHPVDAATNSSLTFSNVQPSQAGNYLVEVTGAYGSTLSSNAVLTVTTDPPLFTLQPTNRTALVGTNVSFTASASGSLPLTYQWFFNTNNLIAGATNSTLVLTNVQIGQAGTYSLLVSNAYGSTNSTNALLTLTFPPAAIRIISTNVMGGNPVDVPIVLAANGNENALNFSINFNTQRLTYASIVLGSGAADAGFLPNTSQAASGWLGITMQLPDGETFAPGTQEVVRVTFLSSILTGTQSVVTPINFTNQPINKLLFDMQGNKLATNFVNGTVTIAVSDFEGDVTPRPTGDRSLDIFDWSQVGRFVAGLDVITNAAEFQRADCAPKSTSGDGQLKVTDWVQAGRYGAAIDSPVVVGGPSAPVTPTILTGGPRALTIGNGTAVLGLPLTLPITLQSQGNENAVGFSLNFDPAVLRYSGVAKGGAAASATMNVNTNQAASGVLGIALALPAGNNFTNGAQEIARVTFTALAFATNDTVAFSDAPVLRAISDPLANELSADYSNSAVSVNPPPTLTISLGNTNALLLWPSWATGFDLQAGGIFPAPGWTNVSSATQTNGSNISVSVPLADPYEFFRLQHP